MSIIFTVVGPNKGIKKICEIGRNKGKFLLLARLPFQKFWTNYCKKAFQNTIFSDIKTRDEHESSSNYAFKDVALISKQTLSIPLFVKFLNSDLNFHISAL